jgi:thioredoxin 1
MRAKAAGRAAGWLDAISPSGTATQRHALNPRPLMATFARSAPGMRFGTWIAPLSTTNLAPDIRRTQKTEHTMATKKVTSSSFDADVIRSDKPVVVDFWAEWCGPCRMIAPALEELSNEMPGVTIAKVNIDENPELAARYGVRSIPTLLMFKDGQLASNMVGAAPKSRLSSWIASAA